MTNMQRQAKVKKARAVLVEEAERTKEIIVIWPDGDGAIHYSSLPDDIFDLIGSLSQIGEASVRRTGR